MSSSYIESSVIRTSDHEYSEEYTAGGFHRVTLGEVYNSKYLVIKKLGYGAFSTVWLCYDIEGKQFYALKIMKSDEFHTGAGEDELKFFRKVQTLASQPGAQQVVAFYDHFTHTGPHGTHLCLVLEVMKVNLLQLLRQYDYAGLPMGLVQSIATQMLQGLAFLHDDCNIVHTDVKPENVMVAYTFEELNEFVTQSTIEFKQKLSAPTGIQFYNLKGELILTRAEQGLPRIKKKRMKKGQNRNDFYKKKEVELFNKVLTSQPPDYSHGIQVKLIDLGNGCFNHRHFSSHIQTRQYRCPESILGVTYNHTADIWSVGCIMFELITGDYLFKPKEDNHPKEIDHLRLMIERLGHFSSSWAAVGKRYRRFFTKQGQLKHVTSFTYKSLVSVLTHKYHVYPAVAEPLVEFLRPMFQYRPERRATARTCLAHPWLSAEPAAATRYFPDSDDEVPEFPEEWVASDDSQHLEADQEDNVVQPAV